MVVTGLAIVSGLATTLGGDGGVGSTFGAIVGNFANETTSFTDAYFAGYTPKLTSAVWVGYPNATTSMPGGFGGTLIVPRDWRPGPRPG